jgi:hypothetical protein
MVLLVEAFQAVAVAEDVPILSVPVLTALITKDVTVPSISTSLPWLCRLANVTVSSLSSLPLVTVDENVVKVGASLTAVTLTVCVAKPMPPFLSVAVKVTVRAVVLGASLLLVNWIAWAVLWTKALVAAALKVNVQALPLLTTAAFALPIIVVSDINTLPGV